MASYGHIWLLTLSRCNTQCQHATVFLMSCAALATFAGKCVPSVRPPGLPVTFDAPERRTAGCSDRCSGSGEMSKVTSGIDLFGDGLLGEAGGRNCVSRCSPGYRSRTMPGSDCW